ncbi:uncharacterized protein LOC131638242 isoform X2 [Vicia villosa]|uniref:uncharacterized protein LOC131638242 isoform X2 n=1 Tax=Vicia villosa TaxID=3911 RepID=UPI00273B768C|nr:uncharacterized protein LOC131638242 isoform X2 [Vicia villosa]
MKFKYEESCRNILQQELHRLKLNCIKNYNHLTMLDASFSPVVGSIHGPAKCQNMPCIQKPDVMTQLYNLGNYNNGQCSNQDVVPCTDSISCDVSCCLKNQGACRIQPDVRIGVTICQLSDILSLLELVSIKMGWQWTNTELVPQLLHVLDSCVVENAAVAIIALLGQLGRFGVDAGGYEDQGIENLRSILLSYLNNFSIKAGTSLQIAAATALFALLPLDLEAVLKNEFNLSAYSSKSISDDTEGLKKWFFGLAEHQRESLYGILKCTD